MFKKTINVLILFFISFTSSAGDSVWKKSYQLGLKGDYELAAAAIESKALSNDEYALLRYAYLKYMLGEYGEAIGYYKKAIEVNPKSIDAKLGITLPLMAQKRWRQVKVYMLQVLNKSHWNYTAHVRLMMAEEGLRKWDALGEHAEQLSEVYPSDATALVYLARANAWKGNVLSAKSAYLKVLIRVPEHIEAKNYLNENH